MPESMMIPRTLFSSDHETFRDTVRKFLENEAVPFNEEWEQQGVVPKDVWLKAGEQGFLCPMVGEELSLIHISEPTRPY